MKTWDVLDRYTGRKLNFAVVARDEQDAHDALLDDEVAWCRETGEVVYR